MSYSGAKLALFLGHDLLVIHRDDDPAIPFPGHLDLPGGGREGAETPVQCVLRETREEVGLCLTPEQLNWSRSYLRPGGVMWFFAAHLRAERVRDIRFGDEGRGWTLMAPDAFIADPMAVPHFTLHLRDYLDNSAG